MRNGSPCGEKKNHSPLRKSIKEDKSELGVEIKIQSPKYKLDFFHEESIK